MKNICECPQMSKIGASHILKCLCNIGKKAAKFCIKVRRWNVCHLLVHVVTGSASWKVLHPKGSEGFAIFTGSRHNKEHPATILDKDYPAPSDGFQKLIIQFFGLDQQVIQTQTKLSYTGAYQRKPIPQMILSHLQHSHHCMHVQFLGLHVISTLFFLYCLFWLQREREASQPFYGFFPFSSHLFVFTFFFPLIVAAILISLT